MRYSETFSEFEVIDTSDGEKLERWGDVILIRPDPQVIWKTPKENISWHAPHAHYHRSAKGGGAWDFLKKVPEHWVISYGNLKFKVAPTGFKHTGLFPEQAVNWDFLQEKIYAEKREVSVLNLFAYTGGATVACAKAGAKVVHVDSSKGMVNWAKENARLSGVGEDRVRYLVDDAKKFIQRECRRGNRYDIIIMDPPSYGRGPTGEVWKLEEELFEFLNMAETLLSEQAVCLLLNTYTTGLSASIMKYLFEVCIQKQRGGSIFSDEIGLRVTQSGAFLPCGQTTIWETNKK